MVADEQPIHKCWLITFVSFPSFQLTAYLTILFTGRIPAYEKIWIFGDEFAFKSFEEYYMRQPGERQTYMKVHYDVSAFVNSEYASANNNALSRMRNLIVHAIQGQVLLPKMIVVVTDDDFITYLHSFDPKLTDDISAPISRIINNIMTEYGRIIISHRDNLPLKSKCWNFPHIWILPPFHDNFANNSQRVQLAAAIESTAKFHEQTSALELKKAWDAHNTGLFVQKSQRFTTEGYITYWDAVDKTVKFCDIILLKKAAKRLKPARMSSSAFNTKYKWVNANRNT